MNLKVFPVTLNMSVLKLSAGFSGVQTVRNKKQSDVISKMLNVTAFQLQ